MRGRRPEADPRFTFHGSWERAEHNADGRGSFAAVERSMVDRLLESSCGVFHGGGGAVLLERLVHIVTEDLKDSEHLVI
jgi:shikimate kinase